jgi:hypothetical protein
VDRSRSRCDEDGCAMLTDEGEMVLVVVVVEEDVVKRIRGCRGTDMIGR